MEPLWDPRWHSGVCATEFAARTLLSCWPGQGRNRRAKGRVVFLNAGDSRRRDLFHPPGVGVATASRVWDAGKLGDPLWNTSRIAGAWMADSRSPPYQQRKTGIGAAEPTSRGRAAHEMNEGRRAALAVPLSTISDDHRIQSTSSSSSKCRKSSVLAVTSVRLRLWAMAAIWPSTNGGVLPPSSSRARSRPCHSAATSSYGRIGKDRRTTLWRYSSRALLLLLAGRRLQP